MKETQNHDIIGILNRLDRFRFEILKSVSSSSSELNEFDRARLESYLSGLSCYLDFVVGSPQLDLPESAPSLFQINDAPVSDPVESEIINDLIRIMDVTRIEIADCQSARRSSGLISFDESRIRSLVSKMENYLIEYVDCATALDLPESSPQAALSGQGNK